MKVREFIKQDIDIDVTDDVTEELYIAFCGPQGLTPEGEKKFQDVLDLEIERVDDGLAVVQIEETGDKWQKNLSHANSFFNAAAGYCSEKEYDRWFVKGEWGPDL